jgi:hypothetical protein
VLHTCNPNTWKAEAGICLVCTVHYSLKAKQTKYLKMRKDLNRHFSKETIPTTNRYMKKGSTLLIFRDMERKNTMECHITLVKMTIIKNTKHSKCLRGIWRKGNLFILLGGNVN